MNKNMRLTTVIITLILISSNYPISSASAESSEVLPVAQVEWEQLNPARGDKSPQAGTLWGNRKADVATGFLVKFVDGFSSPPHIHNVTYRGVVISGLIHNDDPTAEKMWMPTGSFWTQPVGESHITAAKGEYNIAYIEIDSGPYLVHPTEKAFDSGERPINIDPSNIVWLDAPQIISSNTDVKIAYLWGNPNRNELRGTMIKLSPGFTGKLQNQSSIFRAVVIQGQIELHNSKTDKFTILTPGSYFGANQPSAHAVNSSVDGDTILYIRSNGDVSILPKG